MPDNHHVTFGITVSQVFYPGSVDMALVRSFVTRAEALDFESLWVQERIIGGVDSLEPVNLLSYVAALTNLVSEWVVALNDTNSSTRP